MPNFIDLFGNEVKKKRERFIQYLTKGLELENLKSDYKKQFNKYFLKLDEHISPKEKFDAIAVDASGKRREFSNGTYFTLTRASGVENNGNISRKLEANVFTVNGSDAAVSTYFSRKSENLEFKIIEDYINSQRKNSNLKICLIDGSLYSRFMSHAVEIPIKDDEIFIIDYFKRIFRILKQAKEKNIILLGISKDSRDIFFRNALLDEIYYKNREKIRDSLSKIEYNLIQEVIKGIDTPDSSKIQQFTALIDKEQELLKKIEEIYKEYLVSRTDWEIIYRFSEYPGFTFPIEKGLGRREQQKVFKHMINESQSYLSRNFRRYISHLSGGDKSKFLKESEPVIKNFAKIPTFLSFHMLLDNRDNAIKIDIPSWYFNDWHYLTDFPYVKFADSIDPLFEKVLSVIKQLYGGIDNYNLLLSAAHDDAVLRNRVYNEVYEGSLQDKLNINLFLYQKRRIKRIRR
jgi:hypothetical protein